MLVEKFAGGAVEARGETRRNDVRDWRKRYAIRLAITDLLAVIWVVYGVQLAWLGFDVEARGFNTVGSEISYSVISSVIVVAWLATLGLIGSRADRVIGVGSSEYKLIVDASTRLFGMVAILAFLFKIDLARGYILIAFPLGVLVLLASRWMWRQWLGVQRATGQFSSRVLLVGSATSALHIADELARYPSAGYRVVGACVPPGGSQSDLLRASVPVLGDLSALHSALDATRADTVIITSAEELSPQRVRELSWSLEPARQHLVVAPSLTGIAGPRIHTRPVAGLPLIHVETPRYSGAKTLAKRGLDLFGSLFLLLLLSPLLVGIAVVIKLTSTGPVFFHQERVGIGGKPFRMLKFRSMVVDAESLLKELQKAKRSDGNQVLFKMKDDPRVTAIGRFLRRFSLDELPQLLNVFNGTMALVGPRPPLEREVSEYERHVHRRFLVKPGITGLWQVSGRSNLSWEESVRLDLYYVENWSFTGDLVILWRTAKAVMARDGAY
ncbi:polyprenyl glycosylphosphotransferase [Mycetocola zhadangensis]|nr:polyprenyl glycosylphosphotransferase [Mycetocola zhadangensis]